jgi:hypothetical protein
LQWRLESQGEGRGVERERKKRNDQSFLTRDPTHTPNLPPCRVLKVLAAGMYCYRYVLEALLRDSTKREREREGRERD